MKLVRILALVLVLTLLVVGSGAGAQGVSVVIAWEQLPDLPTPVSGSAFSAYLASFYGRDIWDWDTNLEIFPVMVEEIPSPDNGLVTYADVMWDDDSNPDTADVAGQAPIVTYRLRQGMLWSDGEAVTSEDCMFYHNLMMQPDAVDSVGRGFYPDVVGSADIVDEQTITLTYKQPWPDFLNTAVLSCFFPSHKFLGENSAGFTMDADGDGVFDANIDEAPYFDGFNPEELIGYGPYVLSSFDPSSNAVWTLNPNWGANSFEQVPAIDTVITQWILESEQMQNALEVGDVDVTFNFNGSTPVDGDGNPIGYYAMADVEVFNVPGVFVDAVWMNSGPNAFAAMQDVRVREALVAALDRRTIAEQFAGPGTGEQLPRAYVQPSFTPPDLPFREYDVELARQLLTDAGWVDDDADEAADNAAPSVRVSLGVEGVPDGTPIILRFYTTPVVPRPDIQTVMQAQLAQVGVRTQLFVVNGPTVLFATFSERGILYTGSYDLAIYALSNNPLSPNGSPDNFQCSGLPSAENPNGNNNTWFCDEEYDRLDDLIAVTNDPTERLDLRYQAEALFFNASVWHSIRPRPTFYAVRSDRFNVDSMREVGVLSNNYFNHIEFWQPAS